MNNKESLDEMFIDMREHINSNNEIENSNLERLGEDTVSSEDKDKADYAYLKKMNDRLTIFKKGRQ